MNEEYLMRVGGRNLQVLVEDEGYVRIQSDNTSETPLVRVRNNDPLKRALDNLLDSAEDFYEDTKRVNLLWTAKGELDISAVNPVDSGIECLETEFDFFVTVNEGRSYVRFQYRFAEEDERRGRRAGEESDDIREEQEGFRILRNDKPLGNITVNGFFGCAVQEIQLHYIGSPGCEFKPDRFDEDVFKRYCEEDRKKERQKDREYFLQSVLPIFKEDAQRYLRKAGNLELEILYALPVRRDMEEGGDEDRDDGDAEGFDEKGLIEIIKENREDMHSGPVVSPDDTDYSTDRNKVQKALRRLISKRLVEEVWVSSARGRVDKKHCTYYVSRESVRKESEVRKRISDDEDKGQGQLFEAERLIDKEGE